MSVKLRQAQFGLTKAQRDQIAPGDFCGPDQSYPVDSQAHATAAWNLAGHAAKPDAVRACIRRKAKAKGFSLPSTAKLALSFRDLEELVRAALMAASAAADDSSDAADDEADEDAEGGSTPYLDLWIRDMFPGAVVYQSYGDEGPHLWQRTYSIDATTLSVTLGDPQEVRQETDYVPLARMASPALMSAATFSADGALVTREGPIFVLGDYPDRGISVGEADADAAVDLFSPVPLELEHYDTEARPSIFSGKLGTLDSIWRKGTELWGRVTVPRWTDDIWGENGRKVSTVWDIPSKTIERCGLVLNPRVPEAAMFATFAGKRHSTADLSDMQQIHDLAVSQGATCAAKMSQEAPMGEKNDPVTPVPNPADTARFTALETDNKQMAAELAQLRKDRRAEKAAAEVQRLVRERHLLPVKDAVAKFTQALEGAYESDERNLATFSQEDGSKASFAATLIAGFEALPQHGLTEERIPAAIFGGGATGETPAEDDTIKASREAAEAYNKQYAARNGH